MAQEIQKKEEAQFDLRTALDAGMVRNQNQFMAALGGDPLKIERWKTLLMMEINRKPDLAECEPGSLIASALEAAQLGLEFGPKAHAYLVPYKEKGTGKKLCKLMPGYRGMIYAAKQSGETKELRAEAVYEHDAFEYELGLKKDLIHKIAKGNRGSLIAVYAVVEFSAGGQDFEVMDKDQIESVRKRSASDDGPWKTDYAEMAKKSAIRKISKRLDMGEKVAAIVQHDNTQYEVVDTTPKMLMPQEVTA